VIAQVTNGLQSHSRTTDCCDGIAGPRTAIRTQASLGLLARQSLRGALEGAQQVKRYRKGLEGTGRSGYGSLVKRAMAGDREASQEALRTFSLAAQSLPHAGDVSAYLIQYAGHCIERLLSGMRPADALLLPKGRGGRPKGKNDAEHLRIAREVESKRQQGATVSRAIDETFPEDAEHNAFTGDQMKRSTVARSRKKLRGEEREQKMLRDVNEYLAKKHSSKREPPQ
jgi:hypothetical protein